MDLDDFASFLIAMPYSRCQVHAFCTLAPVRDVGYGFGSCAPCGFFILGPQGLRTEVDVRTRGGRSLPFWAEVSILAWDCLIYCKKIAGGAQVELIEISIRSGVAVRLPTADLDPSTSHLSQTAAKHDLGYEVTMNVKFRVSPKIYVRLKGCGCKSS